MIETLTIITLSVLALVFLRPGKTEPLQNPLTINRVGQFHAVLAPMINLAQPLLEGISRHLSEQNREIGNTQPHYFMVHDKEVKAHGADFYLLAATLRNGMLYFQATTPKTSEGHLDTIHAFAEAELIHHPATQPHLAAADAELMAAMQAAANQRGIVLTPLKQ